MKTDKGQSVFVNDALKCHLNDNKQSEIVLHKIESVEKVIQSL